ncbi:MAG: hypothetical protein R8K48_06940 [Gallionella sp.]
MQHSNAKVLILPFITAAFLWLIGGFYLSKELGMVCVIIGLALAGWACGVFMNTPPGDRHTP